MLKNADRYKLFKFILKIDHKYQSECTMIYKMLDEMPELEIVKIYVENGVNEIIEALAEKSMFKTKQDLFNILEIQNPPRNDLYTEPYEFISEIRDCKLYNMNSYVKQVGCIHIENLDRDLNINCSAKKVFIDPISIQKIDNFELGTEIFFKSVAIITLRYKSSISNSSTSIDVENDIDIAKKYFPNSNTINIENHRNMDIYETSKILKNNKINYLTSFLNWRDDFEIKSDAGCVLFYDSKDKFFINFENLEIRSQSEY